MRILLKSKIHKATVTEANLETLLQAARDAGVPAAVLGRTGGDRIRLRGAGRPGIDVALADADGAWSDAIGKRFTRAS